MLDLVTTGEHFKEALVLIIKLHELCESKQGDSQDADEVRDQLDAFLGWCSPGSSKLLTEKERNILTDVNLALQGKAQ